MKRATLLLLPAAALLAACGGGDSDESVSAAPIVVEGGDTDAAAPAEGATVVSSTDEELALEFAQCLRDEGIDASDPEVGADGSIDLLSIFGDIEPGSVSDAQQAAGEACAELLEGTNLLPEQNDLAASEEALLEFAQCLRDEGIDVQDPDVNAIGGGGGAGAGGPQGLFGDAFDLADPDVEAAVQVCAPIMADSGLGPGA
ncbi:MAG: hypothetical protein AAGA99_16615 [Actinomycetota bacterium]